MLWLGKCCERAKHLGFELLFITEVSLPECYAQRAGCELRAYGGIDKNYPKLIYPNALLYGWVKRTHQSERWQKRVTTDPLKISTSLYL